MDALEEAQARHRKENKDLQGRITQKKKQATKKTRKGVNDECAELERQLKEAQAAELAALRGDVPKDAADVESGPEPDQDVTVAPTQDESLATDLQKTAISDPRSEEHNV